MPPTFYARLRQCHRDEPIGPVALRFHCVGTYGEVISASIAGVHSPNHGTWRIGCVTAFRVLGQEMAGQDYSTERGEAN